MKGRPKPKAHQHIDFSGRPTGAAAYERRQSQAAIARHFEQIEADRRRGRGSASSSPASYQPAETRSRFSQRTWEEADSVNPMRLSASDPPTEAARELDRLPLPREKLQQHSNSGPPRWDEE